METINPPKNIKLKTADRKGSFKQHFFPTQLENLYTLYPKCFVSKSLCIYLRSSLLGQMELLYLAFLCFYGEKPSDQGCQASETLSLHTNV